MAVVERLEPHEDGRVRLRLRSPATLEPIGEIAVEGPDEARAALERARKAQVEWGKASFAERGHYLRRALQVLLERQDEFVETIIRETGKPETEAVMAEITSSCDVLAYYAKRAGRILADRTVPVHLVKSKKLRIVYKPVGVVGIITPWNFPFVLSLNPTVQALMAGNAVILKPSEVTPASGQLVEVLFRAAGLPDGLLQVLQGDGSTGAALVEAGVDKISFTGSVRTGRKVAEACGRQLIPCTLELGGKDAMIVCADADLDRAAQAAVYGAFTNAGQVCISTERVYVVDEVADGFLDRVLAATAALRQGAKGEFDVGPMIFEPQLDTVQAHVQDAVERGAEVRTGGRRNPDHAGLFFEPTVLTGVDHEMRVMREETFGPVLPIMRVRDEDEAVRLANDSRYGLNGSVFTKDKHRGGALARAIETGAVVVNDCMTTYGVTESPFGGVKESGIGRVNGEQGLKSYCHVQSILVDRFGSKSEFNWFPYSAGKAKRARALTRWIWGTPLGRWLS